MKTSLIAILAVLALVPLLTGCACLGCAGPHGSSEVAPPPAAAHAH
ncbi:MAG: hypothetical protein HYY24_05560 [Verrucomicrobia bacterium]|nr:hypothetical protein [Verrucomicrobiota bacterium]